MHGGSVATAIGASVLGVVAPAAQAAQQDCSAAGAHCRPLLDIEWAVLETSGKISVIPKQKSS
jgi:hypothetical protein